MDRKVNKFFLYLAPLGGKTIKLTCKPEPSTMLAKWKSSFIFVFYHKLNYLQTEQFYLKHYFSYWDEHRIIIKKFGLICE